MHIVDRQITKAPKVTAVICTFNRENYLSKAIQSLVQQSMPKEYYEIIVVDNNSTDRTREVAASFESEPNFRYLFEPVQGLCQARNTGCKHARGEFVAYLDDDAVAVPGWVQAVAESFEKADRSVGCVGGAIDILWEIPRPDWIPDELNCYYGDLFYDKDWKYLNGIDEYVGGGNSAYPVNLLLSMGGFDTRMGHKGKKIRYSEESILHRQLIQKGHALLYNADMRILHHAGEEKVNYTWLKRRIFWQGYSTVQLELRMGRKNVIKAVLEAAKIISKQVRRPMESIRALHDTRTPSREQFQRRHTVLYELGRAYGLLCAG